MQVIPKMQPRELPCKGRANTTETQGLANSGCWKRASPFLSTALWCSKVELFLLWLAKERGAGNVFLLPGSVLTFCQAGCVAEMRCSSLQGGTCPEWAGISSGSCSALRGSGAAGLPHNPPLQPAKPPEQLQLGCSDRSAQTHCFFYDIRRLSCK